MSLPFCYSDYLVRKKNSGNENLLGNNVFFESYEDAFSSTIIYYAKCAVQKLRHKNTSIYFFKQVRQKYQTTDCLIGHIKVIAWKCQINIKL